MKAARKRRNNRSWPFFLMIAAWFCANTPQSMAFDMMVWAKGARHFSHQEQLKADVAFLLAGSNMKQIMATAKGAAASPVQASVPEDAVVKKIDLSSAETRYLGFRRADGQPKSVLEIAAAGSARAEPAHFPPRASLPA